MAGRLQGAQQKGQLCIQIVALHVRHRPLGLHPARDLQLEVAGGAGDEDEEQDPIDGQTSPRMQLGSALANGRMHVIPLRGLKFIRRNTSRTP